MMATCWITIEGVEGAGKTYLARLLATRLGRRCRLLGEVADAASGTLAGQVIEALSRTGDLWLRTGHPATETLALLALKAAEYEHVQALGETAEIIIEDRGIDSVAIYQALIMAGLEAPADEVRQAMDLIYATARRWRPLPDLTLLLTDTPTACTVRLQQRTGLTISAADRALIARAAELYASQAAREPGRFRVVDRTGRSTEETVGELAEACALPTAGRPSCVI
jgi:dTMP kinase